MSTVTTDPMRQSLAWFKYLNQDKTWIPNGKPSLPITDMDAAWRHNAANWLLKRAKALTTYYALGELQFIYHTTAPTVVPDEDGNPVTGPETPVFAPMGEIAQMTLEQELDESQETRAADPEAWLKSTQLYQALIRDLPDGIADLARHWSTCDLRTGQSTACSCNANSLEPTL